MTTEDLMKLADAYAKVGDSADISLIKHHRSALKSTLEALGREVAELKADLKHTEECCTGWAGDFGKANKELEALRAELAAIRALSVTSILLDVVPGDGSGLEVYAKSVQDVENKLSKMGGELEDWQLGIKRHPLMQERIDILSAELAAIRAQEPVGVVGCDDHARHPNVGTVASLSQALPTGALVYASPAAKDAGLVADGWSFLNNKNGSITVQRRGQSCTLWKAGHDALESLAYEMAAMLAASPKLGGV